MTLRPRDFDWQEKYPAYDRNYSRFVRPRRRRLLWFDRAAYLHQGGFEAEAFEDWVTATALTAPESAGDPQAHLAYVKLPSGARGMAAHVALLAASPYPTYVTGGPSVVTFRALCNKVGAKLVDVDIGLCQIKWWYYRQYSMQELTDPLLNATIAHRVYLDRSKTFRPWAAYTSGYHTKFMDVARSACREWYVHLDSE